MTEAVASTDPTLAVAERQLAMLGELAQMALAVSRGYAAASLAAANAVEVILADEVWQPETGRARALAGARDAADAFQKVSRSLRLTLKLEMATAETVRDLRAGIIADRKVNVSMDPVDLDRCRPGGASLAGEVRDLDRRDSDLDRLVEFDRPDRLDRVPFRETVDRLCMDIGVAPDWKAWRIGRPPRFQPLTPRPPDWSECRPAGAIATLEGLPESADAGSALPP